MPDELYQRVSDEAEADRRSIASMVRVLLEEALDERDEWREGEQE
jgi:hypothetical protein